MAQSVAAALKVIGAGEEDVNGPYYLDDLHDGRPRYRKASATIQWSRSHEKWLIDLDERKDYMEDIHGNMSPHSIYWCDADSATPPLEGWHARVDEDDRIVDPLNSAPIVAVISHRPKRLAERIAGATYRHASQQLQLMLRQFPESTDGMKF